MVPIVPAVVMDISRIKDEISSKQSSTLAWDTRHCWAR
jgi:hypothetical protein